MLPVYPRLKIISVDSELSTKEALTRKWATSLVCRFLLSLIFEMGIFLINFYFFHKK